MKKLNSLLLLAFLAFGYNANAIGPIKKLTDLLLKKKDQSEVSRALPLVVL
ncbi:hypothetical protein [Pedobacter sp. NJ-S-72]